MIHRIEVNSRDVSLFKYLHAQKVATTTQIKRDIMQAGMTVTRRRLQKLKTLGLIEVVSRLEGVQATHVYSLSNDGMKLLKRIFPKSFVQERFRSNSISHDLALVDLKNLLKAKSNVARFYSENELQCLRELNERNDLEPFRSIHADAVIELKSLSGKTMLCALEFEANLKSKVRYRDKVRKYYLARGIPAVLFVSVNPKITSVVKLFEKKEEEGFKKIYFADFSEILSTNSQVIFENQDGLKVAIL